MQTTHPVIDKITDAISEAFTGYEPNDGIEWADLLHAMPGLFTELGAQIKTLGERLGDDYPDTPAVTDSWNDLGDAANGIGDAGEELAQTFEREHEDELKRLREPRQNEEVWDVSKTR